MTSTTVPKRSGAADESDALTEIEQLPEPARAMALESLARLRGEGRHEGAERAALRNARKWMRERAEGALVLPVEEDAATK